MDEVGNKRSNGSITRQGEGAGVFKKMPITLNKKELCIILDCWRNGTKMPNYPRLRMKFFTPEVLNRIGITQKEYNRVSTFDRITTIKIIEVLEITEEAHEYAKDHI